MCTWLIICAIVQVQVLRVADETCLPTHSFAGWPALN